MNKQLQDFFDNTKQLHILLSIVLLMIIVFMIAPISNPFIKYSGQLSIIGILIYILFKNFTETHNFGLIQKNMEKKRLKKNKKESEKEEISEDTILDLKNNTIASYILCGFILLLLLYVIYSIIF
jgi:hypothetical protein